ncbi:MAG: type II CAAX endopeptidase family protein [Bacilli bacterium]
MEFAKRISKNHDGAMFLSSFGFMLFGPVLLLIPFFLLALNYNPLVLFTQEYLQSSSFTIDSLIADGASKILLITFMAVIFFKELLENLRRFRKEWVMNLTYIVGGMISMFILLAVLNVIYTFFGIEGDSANQQILIEATNSKAKPFMFFMIVIAAPFIEEMIFRKFIFGFCEKTMKLSKWWAFAISTIAFAAVHVMTDVDSFIFIFQYLVLSGVISLSYVLSKKNIFVPMGIHFINNLISFIEIAL